MLTLAIFQPNELGKPAVYVHGIILRQHQI